MEDLENIVIKYNAKAQPLNKYFHLYSQNNGHCQIKIWTEINNATQSPFLAQHRKRPYYSQTKLRYIMHLAMSIHYCMLKNLTRYLITHYIFFSPLSFNWDSPTRLA